MIPVEEFDAVEQLGSVFLDVEQKFDSMDYTEPLTAFQEILAEGERAAFAGQREPGGAPWDELSPVTVKKKGHSRILFESGALEASLVTVGGPGNIHAVSSRGSLFGTSDEKSIFHTLGGGRLPKRDHVGTNDEDVDRLAEMVADHVVENLKFKI